MPSGQWLHWKFQQANGPPVSLKILNRRWSAGLPQDTNPINMYGLKQASISQRLICMHSSALINPVPFGCCTLWESFCFSLCLRVCHDMPWFVEVKTLPFLFYWAKKLRETTLHSRNITSLFHRDWHEDSLMGKQIFIGWHSSRGVNLLSPI